MPWSINEGPKTDIILSTPQTKRVRHYTMVQDSEEESDSIKSPEGWSRSGRKPAVAEKHLDLPNIATYDTTRLSSRPLVSDSQPEHDDFEDPPGSAESLTISSPLLPFSSQELYKSPARVPRSPTQRKGNLRPLLSLTKPKPLMLEVPSDIEFTQDTQEQEAPKRQDEVEHRRLREELFSDSIEDGSQPESPTKSEPRTSRMVVKRKQRSFEDSPFAAFPIFSQAARRTVQSSDDDDDSFRRGSSSRANISGRSGSVRDSGPEGGEEEDELLIDRRRSGRHLLSSPSKRARLETIESISTFTDSQSAPTQTHPTLGASASQPEEIGYFTDDEPVVQAPARKERKNRRYSGLEFADRPVVHDLSREKSFEVQHHVREESSPAASRMERCFLCSKMVSVADLEAHVAQELDQQERERLQKGDEELALALDQIYQTQDTQNQSSVADRAKLQTGYPFGGRTLGETFTSPSSKGGATSGGVSLDTPTRKVGNLSLNSPFSLRTAKKSAAGSSNFPATVRKAGSFGISSDEYSSQIIDNEPIDLLSEVESSSSQNVFRIQPGQNERGSKSAGKKPSAPVVITEDKPKNGDDDMDDFVMPEPASMLNKSFRTKVKKIGDTPTPKPTTRRPSNKKTIDLDDSEDDLVEYSRATGASVGSRQQTTTKQDKGKAKFSVLDSVLPESVRLQRNKNLGRTSVPKDNDPHEWDDFSSSVTQRPVAEKLWKPEDDDFAADNMDQRQVRGIGLGGVVGGIGAIPGSLNTSKVTRHAAESQKAQQEADEQAQQQQRPVDDPFSHMPSFEYEDPNYGLASQEWMKSPTPERRKQQPPREDDGFGQHGESDYYGDDRQGPGDGGEDDDDDGYKSPFDDFVDLRKRRDDPAMAMFFNQFEPSAKKKAGRGGTNRSKAGAGSGGSKSTKKSGGGVTYAAGVQQIGNDGSSNKSAFGRNVSFDAPTTSNGSMAVNSKATPSFGRGRGRGGKKSSGGFKYGFRGRGRGRGRGRARGGGGGGGGLGFEF
ncbi:hypothetical protein BGZ93_007620 [Podila epicladia]|nr:hypothetical protein BGZ93_007620 [Podila epicladia]